MLGNGRLNKMEMLISFSLSCSNRPEVNNAGLIWCSKMSRSGTLSVLSPPFCSHVVSSSWPMRATHPPAFTSSFQSAERRKAKEVCAPPFKDISQKSDIMFLLVFRWQELTYGHTYLQRGSEKKNCLYSRQ